GPRGWAFSGSRSVVLWLFRKHLGSRSGSECAHTPLKPRRQLRLPRRVTAIPQGWQATLELCVPVAPFGVAECGAEAPFYEHQGEPVPLPAMVLRAVVVSGAAHT